MKWNTDFSKLHQKGVFLVTVLNLFPDDYPNKAFTTHAKLTYISSAGDRVWRCADPFMGLEDLDFINEKEQDGEGVITAWAEMPAPYNG